MFEKVKRNEVHSMKIKALFFTLLLVIGAALAGCSSDGAKKDKNDKLKIYTTIFPIQDFTKKIGGKYVDAQSVLPPGVDAHSYEPTSKTMVKIAQGDAFIYAGIGLEGFADSAKETLKNEDVKVIPAAKGIKLAKGADHEHEGEAHDDHGEGDEHDHGDKDPHVWLDPIRSIQIAENIKEELVKLQPAHKKDFEKNFDELKTKLEKLDQDYKNTVSTASHKELLVSHAAYGYWEDRYGVHQISIAGLSPTNEPSQKQLKNIIKEAEKHKIKYIIFEKNVKPRVADVVKKEIGAESLTLNNLESVTKEQLNDKEDYFSLMEQNLDVLKKALNK